MSHLSYGRRTLSLKMAERTSDDEGERILEMVANDLFNLEQLAENPATKLHLEEPGRFFVVDDDDTTSFIEEIKTLSTKRITT